MIYKDANANYDSIVSPGFRPNEVCLNCGHTWGEHYGWRCHLKFGTGPSNFDELFPYMRFLTESMRDSLVPKDDEQPITLRMFDELKPTETKAADISDWKSWRDTNKDPNECACGILKSQCQYHK